eukprot:scaffold7581_cov122-Isochrysis_galbana.AAC.2
MNIALLAFFLHPVEGGWQRCAASGRSRASCGRSRRASSQARQPLQARPAQWLAASRPGLASHHPRLRSA